MDRIQEENEQRASQPHSSGKNTRVNSISQQKQNQSINSRTSKSPTNTSRVSFGRTDPNPKNITEKPLNYISDPIKGMDLRTAKSVSPDKPINTGNNTPKAQLQSSVQPQGQPQGGQTQQQS